MPDPTSADPTFMDLVVAVEQERDALRRQVAQLDQANVTLSGQNTDLAEENLGLHAELDALRARLVQTEAALRKSLHEVALHFPESDLFRKRIARIIEPALEES